MICLYLTLQVCAFAFVLLEKSTKIVHDGSEELKNTNLPVTSHFLRCPDYFLYFPNNKNVFFSLLVFLTDNI